jgi:hypothetical protein
VRQVPAAAVIEEGAQRGGWGSNPRPADYEKYGPALRAHYLHGYHGIVPPIALIAPFARVVRSTNRSTPEALRPVILQLCVTSLGHGIQAREPAAWSRRFLPYSPASTCT